MRKAYIIRRTLTTVFLLWFVLTALFFIFRLMPGDPVTLLSGQGASPEAVARTREKWGLDQPLYVQYFQYLINFIQLDAGRSIHLKVDVVSYALPLVFNSLLLAIPGITTGYIIGGSIGAYFGNNRGSRIEEWGVTPIIFVGANPGFFISIGFVIIFAMKLNWFPTSGMISSATYSRFADAPWWRPYLTKDFIHHYTLPFLAVATLATYVPSLIMRTSVVEVKGQDFIDYHKLTGLNPLSIYKRLAHHSILPVITFYPLSIAQAIGGLILIEYVFNWPGMGYGLLTAITSRDVPVLMFIFFAMAAFVIIANFVVDIAYGFIDPRVSIGDD